MKSLSKKVQKLTSGIKFLSFKQVANVAFAWILCLITVTVIGAIFNNFGSMFFFSCILAPIWEEALFRYVPIEISRKVLGEDKFKEIQWPFLLLISIVFGWMHGSPINIFMQGVCGFFMGWVYIKNGYSYLSAVAFHAIWNTVVYINMY